MPKPKPQSQTETVQTENQTSVITVPQKFGREYVEAPRWGEIRIRDRVLRVPLSIRLKRGWIHYKNVTIVLGTVILYRVVRTPSGLKLAMVAGQIRRSKDNQPYLVIAKPRVLSESEIQFIRTLDLSQTEVEEPDLPI